jgi:hypothetical protein
VKRSRSSPSQRAPECRSERFPYATIHASPIVVARPSKDEPSIWWPLTVALYAHALIVCNEQLNWPDPDRVRAINDAMYA